MYLASELEEVITNVFTHSSILAHSAMQIFKQFYIMISNWFNDLSLKIT